MTNSPELALLMSKQVNPDEVNSIIGRILPDGHAIHGYSDSSNRRILMIVESHEHTDGPLLGYGIDGNAERALVRALATYVKREQRGIDYIAENQFPESAEGQISTGHHPSRFDNIVWSGDFKMYQENDSVIAASRYGGGWGMEPLEVRSSSALGAVIALANEYTFFSSYQNIADTIKRLPPISLE